jgi:hypothetical protein
MAKVIENKEEIAEAAATAANGIKMFKSSGEVENFYRLIHENGLRAEASILMQIVLKKITPPKRRGRKKSTLQ